jgi:hypothetical protein
MTLRQGFRPLRPDLDRFLFAAVGDEVDGMPLSVVSALTRLGLDPWQEASRLSSLGRREAVEQLARLIAELPGISRPTGEARDIAGPLVNLLPQHETNPIAATPQVQSLPHYRRLLSHKLLAFAKPSQLWVICFVLAVAVIVSAFVHGGLPFGIGSL